MKGRWFLMGDTFSVGVGDAVAWILLGFGVTLEPNIYFGGLLFGLGCMMLVREFVPSLRGVSRRIAVLASIIVSTLAAIAQGSFAPDVSTTFVMAVSGALGVPLARAFAMRSDQIAEGLIARRFPKSKGPRDG